MLGFLSALLGGERTFEEGMAEGRLAGIEDTISAVEGAGPMPYAGPVPPELREWCDQVRIALAVVEAADEAAA